MSDDRDPQKDGCLRIVVVVMVSSLVAILITMLLDHLG